jgi:hypothetical protein
METLISPYLEAKINKSLVIVKRENTSSLFDYLDRDGHKQVFFNSQNLKQKREI